MFRAKSPKDIFNKNDDKYWQQLQQRMMAEEPLVQEEIDAMKRQRP